MKLWHAYGSEHSMNLFMIGTFQDSQTAATAKDEIEEIRRAIETEENAGRLESSEIPEHFPPGILETLQRLRIHHLTPAELDQFRYDANIELRGPVLILKTDEVDVSAFLKLLISAGARVEIFSGHTHPEHLGSLG
jgi:hypothetical protein